MIAKQLLHFGSALQMSLGVSCQECSGHIQMRVFANAGEDIENLSPVRLGVLHAIRGQDRQSILRGKIDKFTVHPFFAANEMPLEFDKNIFVPESVDKKLRAIRRISGSARVSRAGDDVSSSRTFGRLL